MSGIETSIAPLVNQQVGDDTIAIRSGQIVRSRVQASPAIAARFTGNPAAYVPARADLLVLKTDVEPNELYRTTGATAGALILMTEGLAFLGRTQTYTRAQQVASAGLTDAATIATNASLSNVFTVTLGGNRTLGAPTNVVSGGTYLWVITQDGTGSRTLAYDAVFKFPGGTDPVLSTAGASVDLLTCVANGADSLLCNLTKGFA
jgi:hypothetical protein